jgi:gas vesicle protein
MSDRDSTSFFTGLVLGAVVGMAIGFLYAPQPGKETREILKQKAEIARQKATEVAHKVKQTATEASEKVQSALK